MDRGPTLGGPSPAEGFEQAIFTSIQSPTARGYRIVGASPGVTDDERRELMVTCPSHGALLDAGPGGTGTTWLELPGGRRCLLFARHAGPEPSGRGGLRVHTHAVIGADEQFAPFGALPRHVAQTYTNDFERMLERPPERCPRLALPAAAAIAAEPAIAADLPLELLLQLVDGLLSGRTMLVCNDPQPAQTVEAVLALTPLGVRLERSFAWGVRYAAPRRATLMFLGADEPVERIARECDGQVVDRQAPERPVDSEYEDWLAFIENGWESFRGEIVSLAARARSERSPAALSRLITLWWELSRLERLDLAALERVLEREAIVRPPGELSRQLRDQLLERGAVRRAELAELERQRAAEAAAQAADQAAQAAQAAAQAVQAADQS